MPKFRKKPVVVEAFQMTEARRSDNRDWPHWLNEAWQREAPMEGALVIDEHDLEHQRLVIWTKEGRTPIYWDDWIIQGVKGELYPCRPDIFEETYHPEEDAP